MWALQPTIPTTTRFSVPLASPLGPASLYPCHCNTRAAQNVKMHDRPTFDRLLSHLNGQFGSVFAVPFRQTPRL